MQKKKFLIFLCLALLVVFAGCSNKEAKPVDISGNYVLEQINDLEKHLDDKKLIEFEKFTLDITKENEAKLVIKAKHTNIKMQGVAKVENKNEVTIDFQDESTANFVGTSEGDTLILTDTVSNMKYTFVRK